MKKLYVCIFGPMGHGKSTLAKKLCEKLSLYATIIPFALKVKELVASVVFNTSFSFSKDKKWKKDMSQPPYISLYTLKERLDEYMEKYDLPLIGFKDLLILGELTICETVAQLYRKSMQLIGTEIFRYRDEDFWIKRFKELASLQPSDVIIIDDGRFPNEFDFVKKNDGITIGIERQDLLFEELMDHESEKYTRALARSCDKYFVSTSKNSIDSIADQVAGEILAKLKEFQTV